MDYNIDNYTVRELFELFKGENSLIDENGNDVKQDINLIIQNIEKNKKEIINNDISNKEKILDFFNKAIYKLNANTSESSSFIINYNNKINYESSLVNSNNNKYFKRDISEKVLVIDSKYREKYLLSTWNENDISNKFESTSSNFTMTLNQDINNVIQIQLGDIEFPNTWYPFSNELGNLLFKIKKEEQDDWIDITINEGIYSYAELINTINLKLDDSINIDDDDYDIKLTINIKRDIETGSNNGQATINITNGNIDDNPTGPNFIINFFYDETNTVFNAQQKLGWNLGFRNINKLYYSGKNTYTAESIVDTVVLRYFYLILDDGLTSTVASNIIPIGNTMNIIPDPTSILARMSVKGSLLSNVNSQGVSLYSDIRKYPSMVNLSKFRIKILNEFGKVVNLHTSDLSFTIKASIIQSS